MEDAGDDRRSVPSPGVSRIVGSGVARRNLLIVSPKISAANYGRPYSTQYVDRLP